MISTYYSNSAVLIMIIWYEQTRVKCFYMLKNVSLCLFNVCPTFDCKNNFTKNCVWTVNSRIRKLIEKIKYEIIPTLNCQIKNNLTLRTGMRCRHVIHWSINNNLLRSDRTCSQTCRCRRKINRKATYSRNVQPLQT